MSALGHSRLIDMLATPLRCPLCSESSHRSHVELYEKTPRMVLYGRPEFDRLCRDAAKRQFDLVMAWSVDRLGRSLKDLVGFLSELHALKIDLFLHQQGLDTMTPAGKAVFQMLGVFAEFERSIIQERVRAGLKRARSEGKRLGRPPLAPALVERIRKALNKPGRTEGVRRIAARFGVDPSTVQRISRPFDARAGVACLPRSPSGR